VQAEPVPVLVPSLYVLSGAIAYAMLYSLVAPAGRRDAPALHAFSATCLFAALVALFGAQVLQASTGAQFLRALKSNLDCLVLTALAFSVFVTRYARLQLPWHESIVMGLGRGGPLAYFAIVALEGVVVYSLAVLLLLYRRTRERSALWMLAALASFVPFAVHQGYLFGRPMAAERLFETENALAS
jgi:hypothetical protein